MIELFTHHNGMSDPKIVSASWN